jgi:GNAT superfamily N-acetyltransferase
MIEYRDAVTGDAAALSTLSRQSFTDTFGHLYRPEDLAAFLDTLSEQAWAAQLGDPGFRIRIAEDDGVAAGFAKLGPPALPVERRGPSAELRQLYVLGAWHGTGVAATLMDWAIETSRAEGARDLYLSVFIENHRARRFYEKRGFERVGTYTFMVGEQADEDDLMRLAL